MNDLGRMEQASVEREARSASVRRTSRGPLAKAVEAAVSQYLAAEELHDAPRAAESRGAAEETPEPRSEGPTDSSHGS